MILRKLEYFRASGSDRHLRDAALMFHISGDLVDEAEFRRWTEKLDLRLREGSERTVLPPGAQRMRSPANPARF